jgi:hypothetical protein
MLETANIPLVKGKIKIKQGSWFWKHGVREPIEFNVGPLLATAGGIFMAIALISLLGLLAKAIAPEKFEAALAEWRLSLPLVTGREEKATDVLFKVDPFGLFT